MSIRLVYRRVRPRDTGLLRVGGRLFFVRIDLFLRWGVSIRRCVCGVRCRLRDHH
ncbi:hypothetical protein [Propionibacterium phage TCUCAP1]|nr:hypothetical protein [Propionibacterium phage TCUCAP1]